MAEASFIVVDHDEAETGFDPVTVWQMDGETILGEEVAAARRAHGLPASPLLWWANGQGFDYWKGYDKTGAAIFAVTPEGYRAPTQWGQNAAEICAGAGVPNLFEP